MANKTISMSRLRQIIRLKEQGISNRKVSSLLGIHRETIRNYTNQMEQLGLSYQELLEQEDLLLENLFVKHKHPAKDAARLSQMLEYYPTM